MKTIFENRMRMSNWAFLALGFVMAAVIVVWHGEDVALSLAAIGTLAAVTVAVLFAFARFGLGNQLAALAYDGTRLEAERFVLAGKGRRFAFPAEEATDWRWLTRTARGRRFAILAFTYAGVQYTMPLADASVVDTETLSRLAPLVEVG